MKLESLNDVNKNNDSIVRLFEFDKVQAEKLRQAISNTVIKSETPLDLTTLDFIDPINCNLIFSLADTDIGIVVKDNNTYICLLSLAGYQTIIKLLEPFCHAENVGYQWLYDNDNPIDLLFSTDGSW